MLLVHPEWRVESGLPASAEKVPSSVAGSPGGADAEIQKKTTKRADKSGEEAILAD